MEEVPATSKNLPSAMAIKWNGCIETVHMEVHGCSSKDVAYPCNYLGFLGGTPFSA